jgi:hypothetical protein
MMWKLFFPLFLLATGAVAAGGRTDFQIWNYNRVEGEFNRTVGFYAELEFRFRNSATQLYYNHEHIEFPIRVAHFLLIGPAYRQVFTLSPGQKTLWTTTYQPNLNATFEWNFGPWFFYDRHRVSWLIQTGISPNVWQYRNKLGVYRVLSQKLHEVRVFADGEIFLEQKRSGIYENRASVGFNVGLFKKTRMDLAYRKRNVRQNGEWEHDNVLMLNLYAHF